VNDRAGVEHDPHAGDLVANDLEGVHRQPAVTLLSRQSGLAVDAAFQEPHVARYPTCNIDQEVRDIYGAFDWLKRRAAGVRPVISDTSLKG
jgi:hypothetical protein